MKVGRISALTVCLGTIAAGSVVGLAQAEPTTGSLRSVYCTTTVGVATEGRAGTQIIRQLNPLVDKATPLITDGTVDGRRVYLPLGDYNLTTGTFAIKTLNYDIRTIDALYRYDYRVTQYSTTCTTAW